VEPINTAEVTPYCRSVHTYKGITYAGCVGGVYRIDENNKVTKPFISIKDEDVMSISVHNDRIYTLSSSFTLSSDSTIRVHDLFTSGDVCSISVHNDQIYTLSAGFTVRVHDLEGTSITSWTHTDKSKCINQLAIINNQIAIPGKLNKTLVFYSLNGEVVNTLPCPLLTDTPVRLSAADNNSVIISQCDSSLVYKVDTSSGDIIWQCKEVAAPRGVTCYRDEFVLVADDTIPTTLCVLSSHTG